MLKPQTYDEQGDTSRCPKPPVDFKTKVPLCPVQARPGQNGTFVLKSMGGFGQGDVSPCTCRISLPMWRTGEEPHRALHPDIERYQLGKGDNMARVESDFG